MPIKRENAAKYPGGSIRSPEWLVIREAVRERAGDRCEECGVENGAIGLRLPDEDYKFCPTPDLQIGDLIDEERDDGRHMKVFRIVCTVAHVDNALVDHSLSNLRFWCQKCHLSHDSALRKAAKSAP